MVTSVEFLVELLLYISSAYCNDDISMSIIRLCYFAKETIDSVYIEATLQTVC